MNAFCRLCCVAVLALASGGPAAADDAVDGATKTAIQNVITKQLEAFAHEDAAAAESLASQGIRKKFPEPNKFFEMVKKNYAALIKPRRTTFGEIASSPHGPLQKLVVVASDGTVWNAIYSLENVEGNWRISGCGLEKRGGEQDI